MSDVPTQVSAYMRALQKNQTRQQRTRISLKPGDEMNTIQTTGIFHMNFKTGKLEAISTESALQVGQVVSYSDDAKAEGIRLAAERDQAKSDKAKKDAEERTRIIAKYPYLTQYDYSGKASSYAVGAKNMRKELERAFPGVKFSCRSKSYSGGCSIHASWTDGPTEAQASPIVDKYQECDFDGMDDSTSYRHSVWPEVFGGAKYTSASRHESPALTVKAALALGYELTEADFDQHGNLDETRAHLSYEICQMIYREARKTSGK